MSKENEYCGCPSHRSYKIGDTVYVKPDDWDVLKGKVKGFQKIGQHLPIVECKHPYKKGEMFSNAFDLACISKTPTITRHEWKLVPIKHIYKGKT